MKLIITGYTFGFPNGTGATARVLSYARGFAKCGVDVSVVCLKPTEPPNGVVLNAAASGDYNGVPFEYASGNVKRSPYRFANSLAYLKSLVRLFIILRREASRQKTAVLAFLCDDPSLVISLVFICRLAGVCLIGERSEFPFVYVKPCWRTKLAGWINDHLGYPNLDGIIVISTLLQDHFSRIVGKRSKVIKIPIIVDVNQFTASTERLTNTKTVTYCGNLDHAGEVCSVLDCFTTATREHPEWRLKIIGGASSPDALNSIRADIVRRGLLSRVELTGLVRRDDLPRHLLESDILILPRKAGLFSQAGFPTKLGEYLATGKPVIVTATGDIPLYLEDGVNAYLTPPESLKDFAEKLEYIIRCPDCAISVGAAGRMAAIAHFDAKVNCEKIRQFIAKIFELQ